MTLTGPDVSLVQTITMLTKIIDCSLAMTLTGPPGVLWIWGEWLFNFRELGSTGNYFQGFGEQAYSFGDLGSPAKK